MGPSTIVVISFITSRNFFPVFEMSEGFVVTPSITPSSAASLISFTSAVSMKNFI